MIARLRNRRAPACDNGKAAFSQQKRIAKLAHLQSSFDDILSLSFRRIDARFVAKQLIHQCVCLLALMGFNAFRYEVRFPCVSSDQTVGTKTNLHHRICLNRFTE